MSSGLQVLRERYERDCTGFDTVAIQDPGGHTQWNTVRRAETAPCKALHAPAATLLPQLKHDGAQIEEVTRREGILPGFVRELATRYAVTDYVRI